MSIQLKKTVELIASLFFDAETKLISKIGKDFPAATEEQITDIFHEILAEVLEKASKERKIEEAFIKDINSSFHNIENFHINKLSKGLIASVSWHNRVTEGRSGGDIGLLFVQPTITAEHNGKLSLIRQGNRQALLVQAKRKKFQKPWRQLTLPQQKNLKDRTEFLSLLRFEYVDNQNRNLKPFVWTLCKGYKLDQLMIWLTNNNFPNSLNTPNLIKDLGFGKIGTKDYNIIESIIFPDKIQTMVIIIDWKDDDDPQSVVITINNNLEIKQEQEEVVKIYVFGS